MNDCFDENIKIDMKTIKHRKNGNLMFMKIEELTEDKVFKNFNF